jgi:hypothetical protein
MKMRVRVPVDIENLHFLDHSLRRCRGYPGGPLAHIRYAWQLQWRITLARRTICRIGHHRPVTGWTPGTDGIRRSIRLCSRCLMPLDQ